MKRTITILFLVTILAASISYAQQNNGVPEDVAIQALLRADSDVREMKSFNLSTFHVSDVLTEAKLYYIGTSYEHILVAIEGTSERVRKDFLNSLLSLANTTAYVDVKVSNYSEVLRLTQSISDLKKTAYDVRDMLDVLNSKAKTYHDTGLNISDARVIIENAQTSFTQERYDESISLIEDADARLNQIRLESERREGVIYVTNVFIRNYWPHIIVIMLILAFISRPIFIRVNVALSKRKMRQLTAELRSLESLLKKAQTECYKDRTLTESGYRVKADIYSKRMEEIKEQIPLLQSIARGESSTSARKRSGLNIK